MKRLMLEISVKIILQELDLKLCKNSQQWVS
jgi:hypothetical protein